jgi:hypothetical protein
MVTALDQPNHILSLAGISGTQKSSDEKWNNSTVTYWGITDTVDGKGTQRGYFVNDHGNAGRDFGAFEAKVASVGGQVTVEGTWQYTGGTGDFRELTGKGTFTTRLTSPTEVGPPGKGPTNSARQKPGRFKQRGRTFLRGRGRGVAARLRFSSSRGPFLMYL